jgi:putative flippase GtrA
LHAPPIQAANRRVNFDLGIHPHFGSQSPILLSGAASGREDGGDQNLADYLNEGLRYLVMSGVSAILSLGIPFALHESLSVPPYIAVAFGLGTAFVVNFATAKLYVFKTNGSVKAQLGRFTLVSLFFRLAEYLAFLFVYSVLCIQYMIANMFVLLLSFCLKFFVYKIFVFAHSEKRLQAAAGV